jgi:hypothetical protein
MIEIVVIPLAHEIAACLIQADVAEPAKRRFFLVHVNQADIVSFQVRQMVCNRFLITRGAICHNDKLPVRVRLITVTTDSFLKENETIIRHSQATDFWGILHSYNGCYNLLIFFFARGVIKRE